MKPLKSREAEQMERLVASLPAAEGEPHPRAEALATEAAIRLARGSAEARALNARLRDRLVDVDRRITRVRQQIDFVRGI